jgi:5-bromo-4-chloroindolyl phosphate hydrolysis protein
MREIYKKSVIPVYLTGFSWLIYTLLFPLYELTHFIIATVVAVALYFVSSALIPSKKVYVKEEAPKTGIPQVDELIARGRMYVSELEKLGTVVGNSEMSADVERIIKTSGRMFSLAAKNPDLAGRLNPFMDYYFPTLIKLLDTYMELSWQPQAGVNITAAKGKIDGVTGTIADAFDKALDNMYSDTALDITADIAALKNIITVEGLG